MAARHPITRPHSYPNREEPSETRGLSKVTDAAPRQDLWALPPLISATKDEDSEANGAVQPPPSRRRQSVVSITSSRHDPPPAVAVSIAPQPSFYTTVAILAHLSLFSLLGTLSRLGLSRLTTYPSAPVTFPVLWSNFAGSLLIGFLSAVAPPEAKSSPFYVALATGYCGSLTSFSTFMHDVFTSLANDSLPASASTPSLSAPPRARGDSVLAPLAVLIVTLTVSVSALHLGAHLARLLPLSPLIRLFSTRALSSPPLPTILFLASYVIILVLTLLPSFTASHPSWRASPLFALLLSPPGCLLRYYLSRGLNPRTASFPLGTFAANILGTLVLAVAFDVRHLPAARLGSHARVKREVLRGFEDGFCACLSTVSSFVLELDLLSRRGRGGAAWVYGGASVGVGVSVLVAVMGGVRWSVGFREG